MNLLCSAFKTFWFNLYNNYVKNIDEKSKIVIGAVCLILSIFVFIMSTKGGNKAEMINNWFLFWISLILFGVSILYWSVL